MLTKLAPFVEAPLRGGSADESFRAGGLLLRAAGPTLVAAAAFIGL